MVLTITQFVEALFIALVIVFATSPQLLHSLNQGQQVFRLFHLF